MPDLHAIDLARYATDKTAASLANYLQQLGPVADGPMTMLELGVKRGGSMLLWRDLFPKATIAGLDLNRIELDDASGRIHLYNGYQQDKAILDRIRAEVAPDGFDLIIDDASHIGRYTAETFWHLFPNHLKPGGIYVLEDWACAYWQNWTDGHKYAGKREALGERYDDGTGATGPESIRRRVRAAARPVAHRLDKHPTAKSALMRLYMRGEGATFQRRFPSHDYGMVGFLKQLIDASAIEIIDSEFQKPLPIGRAIIRSVHVERAAAFIRKQL